jgi:lysozyme family protein
MVASSFQPSLAFVWRPENDGQPDHTDPGDSGGETNMGVTIATWNGAVSRGLVSGALATASSDDLALILKVDFWRVVGCDSLPAGDDLAVFNFAMAAGPGTGARVLQSMLGVGVDGDVGTETLAAAAKLAPGDLIPKFTAAEETFYAHCAGAPLFLRGWDRRAEDCKALALQLAGATP